MTQSNSSERKSRSVPVSEESYNDAFDAATKLRVAERRAVSQTAIFERWLEAGHAIYCAKTREEGLAAFNALFDSNPDHQE